MSAPLLEEGLGTYTLEWRKEKVKLVASAVAYKPFDGRLTGLITVRAWDGSKWQFIHHAHMNLLATRTQKELEKTLREKWTKVDWSPIVDEACHFIEEWASRGEPVEEVWSNAEWQPPEYLVEPILLKDDPNILFGEAESGKSTMALVFAICMLLPWTDNPLDLAVPTDVTKLLYLDYESSKSRLGYRLKGLEQGMNLASVMVEYRHCDHPLSQEVEQLRKVIAEKHIGCVVVDSLAQAAGGDINRPEAALPFFEALRQLRVSSIILAHTAKDHDVKKRTIFGSVFFHNYARQVWFLDTKRDALNGDLDVTMRQVKGNDTGRHPDVGFRISFEHGITVTRTEPETAIETLEPGHRIVKFLSDNLGEMTRQDLKVNLGDMSEDAIDKHLRRLCARGRIVKDGRGRYRFPDCQLLPNIQREIALIQSGDI